MSTSVNFSCVKPKCKKIRQFLVYPVKNDRKIRQSLAWQPFKSNIDLFLETIFLPFPSNFWSMVDFNLFRWNQWLIFSLWTSEKYSEFGIQFLFDFYFIESVRRDSLMVDESSLTANQKRVFVNDFERGKMKEKKEKFVSLIQKNCFNFVKKYFWENNYYEKRN